jgi:hypothetical protein
MKNLQTIYIHSSFKSNPFKKYDFSKITKPKNTYLTSLFNFPIKKKTFSNIIYFTDVENHLDNNPLFNSNNLNKYKKLKIEPKQTKKSSNEKIEKFMKEKYYEDVEKFTKHKLERKNWFTNSSTQNKVITIKKIIKFWEGLYDYSSPRFSKQKFKSSKMNDNNIKNVDIKKDNEEKKIPVLYTTHRILNKKHLIKIKNEKNFYEQLKKNQNIKIY